MITYNNILSRMQNKFSELSGYNADDASDIGLRLKVLAGEIYSSYTNMEFIKNQMFPQTATGSYLDMHARQRGIERIGATKSNGYLKFSRPSNLSYDVTIPKGTICSTAGTNGVRFITLENACIQSGDASVSVLAESEDAGTITNTLSSTITVMVTPPAGVKSVTNEQAFIGGTDSESDDFLRERLLDSYKNISNGSNCAFYKNIALKNDDVYSASVVSRPSGSGTVDIYVASNGSILTSDKMSAIQSDINALREINVNATVKAPTLITVNVVATILVADGYESDTIKANCATNLQSFFSTLHIGEDVLAAEVGEAIYHTEGVKNYKFTSTADKTITNTQLAILGTTSITVQGADS